MIKKSLAILSLAAVMATTASASIEKKSNNNINNDNYYQNIALHFQQQHLKLKQHYQHYLNKEETIKLLKILPRSDKMIKNYKNGKTQIFVSNKNPDYYIVMIKDKNSKLQQFFISKDKKYAVIGTVFDIKNDKILTDHPPVNASIVKKGVAFTFGTGKEAVYLVTDPQCPFCKMLNNNKKAMKALADKYTVNVILYPLPFHHQSKAMILYILQGKTPVERQKRLKAIFEGSTAYQNVKLTEMEKRKLENKMKAGMKAAKELNFKGTPSMFDKNFNPADLSKFLTTK